jgi:prolycopene isomerase
MPDLEFTFPRLLPDIQAELQRHFQHEATGIESFFRTFQKLYRSVWRADERDQLMFSRLSAISFEQLLRDHISDQRCRQIIAGQWPYLAVPPSRLAALEGVLTLGSYLLQGTYYPKGGTQALANAYLQRFETLGGTVSLNTPVRTIHSEGNRICGVWLDHERLISTKAVVANIAPHTLLNLLNTDLARDICRCNISNLQTTSSAFLCYFGFNSKADLSPIPWGFYFGPDYESLDRWLFVSKPSHHDSSLAPNGGQIICTMLGYNGPFHPKHNFAQMKTDAFDFILDIFTKRSPEIHRYLEVKTTASPATIHRYTGNYNGTVYGWASTVQQSGKQRLSYEFALPGLFLVGHWTQPGSGVPAVTLSGLNLAPRISQFLCP